MLCGRCRRPTMWRVQSNCVEVRRRPVDRWLHQARSALCHQLVVGCDTPGVESERRVSAPGGAEISVAASGSGVAPPRSRAFIRIEHRRALVLRYAALPIAVRDSMARTGSTRRGSSTRHCSKVWREVGLGLVPVCEKCSVLFSRKGGVRRGRLLNGPPVGVCAPRRGRRCYEPPPRLRASANQYPDTPKALLAPRIAYAHGSASRRESARRWHREPVPILSRHVADRRRPRCCNCACRRRCRSVAWRPCAAASHLLRSRLFVRGAPRDRLRIALGASVPCHCTRLRQGCRSRVAAQLVCSCGGAASSWRAPSSFSSIDPGSSGGATVPCCDWVAVLRPRARATESTPWRRAGTSEFRARRASPRGGGESCREGWRLPTLAARSARARERFAGFCASALLRFFAEFDRSFFSPCWPCRVTD